ncbi:MAG: AraC family transcriptional regulator [Deinococcota bacterium]
MTLLREWVWSDLSGVTLSIVNTKNQSYPKKYLLNYNFGVRLVGQRTNFYRGEYLVTGPSTSVYQPGEVLEAHPISLGRLSYISLCFEPEAFSHYVRTVLEQDRVSVFPQMVPADHANWRLSRLLLDSLKTLQGATLERDESLLKLVSAYIFYCAEKPLHVPKLGQEHRIVSSVKDYLHSHVSQNISLKLIAQHCQLSPWYVQRVFKAELGVSPHEYLTALRLHKAKFLLRQGKSTRQVASQLGFHDRSHLTQVFKRFEYLSPAAYRAVVRQR